MAVASPKAIKTGGLTVAQHLNTICSSTFDIDSGTTPYSEVVFVPNLPITIRATKVIYMGATTGTIDTGTVKVGVSAGSGFVADATNFLNGAPIGAEVELEISNSEIDADQPVIVTWTGVSGTQAGLAKVQIDYAYNA